MKASIDQLSLFGGAPAFVDLLHVGRPNIGNKDKFFEQVNDLFNRRWLTNDGPFVRELESRIANHLNVKECVALCNGTIALEVLLRCLNLEGEVILPSFTFVSSAHVLESMNLKPVFCDVDPETHNLTPDLVEPLITPRTAAILGVHLWGSPCPVNELTELADQYSLPLVFDAAHAFSCTYQNEFIGNFGVAEVFSFHATKFFHTFEGGAVVTNDSNLANEVRLRRNFGFSRYDHVDGLGTNGKMPEVSAAMGLTNLDDLGLFLETNHRNYKCYEKHLKGLAGINLLHFDAREKNNFQYVVLTVEQDVTQFDRDLLIEVLHAENVLARRYFHPGVHRMEPYKSLYPKFVGNLPGTESLSQQVMCLPTGTSVDPDDIQRICDIIKFVGENCIEIRRKHQSRLSTLQDSLLVMLANESAEVKQPLVSVHMLTYNHAPYIAQAIDSVLMQEVSFDYELVIGDDCSTDGTGKIVQAYRDKYPDIIRLHQQERNLGLYANQDIVRRSCRGKYIAWLEGDDYWTCSQKLQKQVDLLESHPEYSCCFHWTNWIEPGCSPHNFGPPHIKPFFTLDDLLRFGHFVPTSSVLLRHHLKETYPAWMKVSDIMDMSYLILFAQYGHLGFIDEVMSSYLHHGSGVFSGKEASQKIKKVMFTHQLAGRNLGLDKRPSFKMGMSRMYGNLFTVYLQKRQLGQAVWSLLQSIYWSPRHRISKIFRILLARK